MEPSRHPAMLAPGSVRRVRRRPMQMVSLPLDLLARIIPDTSKGGNIGYTGTFLPIPFTVGTTPTLIRSAEERRYFFILNTSALLRLSIGFSYEPTMTNGIILEANLGAYEPETPPRNDIYAVSSGAGATGVLIVVTV